MLSSREKFTLLKGPQPASVVPATGVSCNRKGNNKNDLVCPWNPRKGKISKRKGLKLLTHLRCSGAIYVLVSWIWNLVALVLSTNHKFLYGKAVVNLRRTSVSNSRTLGTHCFALRKSFGDSVVKGAYRNPFCRMGQPSYSALVHANS